MTRQTLPSSGQPLKHYVFNQVRYLVIWGSAVCTNHPWSNSLHGYEALQKGYRMPHPTGCPDKLYDIMLDCWKEEPSIFETLKQLHSSSHHTYNK